MYVSLVTCTVHIRAVFGAISSFMRNLFVRTRISNGDVYHKQNSIFLTTLKKITKTRVKRINAVL